MPTLSDGREGVVTASGEAATEMDREAVAVCDGLLLSVAMAVKAEVIVVVGVPEIAPVVWLRVRPGGREPPEMDHL